MDDNSLELKTGSIPQKTELWCRIDIFCPEEELGNLISDYLQKLFWIINGEIELNYYFLTVNNTDRPHICLHLLLSEESFILPKIISAYRKKSIAVESSMKDLFKIEMTQGVDQRFLSNPIADPKSFCLAKELTQLVFKISDNEIIEEEKLLEFSLHLHLCWIKVRSLTEKISYSSILTQGYHLCINDVDDSRDVLKFMSDLYAENRDTLNQIADGIMTFNRKKTDILPFWFEDWFNLCILKSQQNQVDHCDHPMKLEIINYLIPNYINVQLGLSKNLIFLQCYLINKLLTNL